MEARRTARPGATGGGKTNTRSGLALTVTFLPAGLLVALVGWTLTTVVLTPAEVLVVATSLLAVAVALAIVGALREMPYADIAAIFLVGATFYGVGVFLAPLGLEELYAFSGVGIFTMQVTRFRSMVRPFVDGADEQGQEALRSMYISFLQRLGFMVILVVLISLMLFVASTASIFTLTTELSAFLLALGILLALLAISRLRS